MNETLDFQARIDGIQRILGIGEYTTAATECVKLSEQALRRMVSQYIDQVDDKVRGDVQDAVRKRVRGDGGIEKLTMGQMIYTLRDAKFLEDWARITGKSLSSLQVIDLEKLTQLRNKIMHDGAEATRTEAEFLLHGLKMILETFGLLTFDAAMPEPAQGSRSRRRQASELPAIFKTKSIDFLKVLPNLDTPAGQRAFIFAAGLDAELQGQIQFDLPLAQFVPFLVSKLVNYGELQDGRSALIAVLETAQQYIGRDRQAICEALVREVEDYLKTAPPPPEAAVRNIQETPFSEAARSQQINVKPEENIMSATQDTPQDNKQVSGITFSGVSGNISFVVAGGSGSIQGKVLAGGDIIEETTISAGAAAVTHGFQQDTDKTEFLKRLEELRVTLRELRNAIGALEGVDEDDKDQMTMAIAQQVKDLAPVKETAETTPIGRAVPKEQVALVRKYVDATTTLMEQVKKMGAATTGAENIASAATKALSLLTGIRQVFGLLIARG